jgi:Uma2 family endonuclease
MTAATNRSLEERVKEEGVEALSADLEAGFQDLPELPPCDLYSDEPEMETNLHLRQMLLLIVCLEWFWRQGGGAERTDYFASGNLTIYYSQNRIKNRDFRGPDFFVVKGVEPRERKSWTIWEEEGRYPDVIVEILSDSTETVDRTTKKELYQTTFRTPEYFWFDPESLEFAGFYLVKNRYQAITPHPQGWLWSDELNLFLGIHDRQLRYFTAAGELVPTPQESALLAEQQRRLAEERANQATQRAERLAEKLRELNIDPDA